MFFLAGILMLTQAFGASFNVNPVMITLSGETRIASTVVKNEDTRPIRFEVSVYSWSQSPDKDIIMKPTHDLIFFPKLLTLQPGESRTIRIGTQAGPPPVEKAYRLFVHELPALNPNKPGQVQMLLQVSIPVYYEPDMLLSKASLGEVSVKNGVVAIPVLNKGNVHFTVQSIAVSVLRSDGQEIFSKAIPGWYILAGGERIYRVKIPSEACSGENIINVEVKTNRGDDLKAHIEPSPGECLSIAHAFRQRA